jgi:site-specific recombinase XerD
MDTHLPAHVPTHTPARGYPPVLPSVLADRVADLRGASKAENTRRAYQSDWRAWETWCLAHDLVALPAHPATVCAYLADQADRVKVSTLRRHLATVSKAHEVAGMVSPCRDASVKDTLAGLRREKGTHRNEAAGLLRDGLLAALDTLGGDMAGLRDRALLLVGWCAGLRRSELAALTWGDLTPDPDGLVLTLRRSKTDQAGEGRQVGLAREMVAAVCPVGALNTWREWLAHQGAHLVALDAPVFVTVTRWGHLGGAMSGQAVGAVIERRTHQAGLPVRYRGHSLRKGLVQQATLAGVADSAVMATTGHKTVTMLRRYQGQAGLVSKTAHRGLLS